MAIDINISFKTHQGPFYLLVTALTISFHLLNQFLFAVVKNESFWLTPRMHSTKFEAPDWLLMVREFHPW